MIINAKFNLTGSRQGLILPRLDGYLKQKKADQQVLSILYLILSRRDKICVWGAVEGLIDIISLYLGNVNLDRRKVTLI